MTDHIKSKLEDIAVSGMVSSSIALGRKLHLFDAIHAVAKKDAPADAETIAKQAGCKPRYVREWLAVMACAGLIEVTPCEKFYIKDAEYHELSGFNNFYVAKMGFLPTFMQTFDELAGVFKEDGKLGLEYSQFAAFYANMDEVTRAMHEKHLFKDYFPLIGMQDRLTAGGLQILDVGCGSGFHAIKMARAFPKCHVTAIDISESAIEMAVKAAAAEETPLTNLEFHVMNAGAMRSEWSARFDFVTIFDSCHDQRRPDLCLREIYRLLKPEGTFAMLEIRGTSSIHQDLHTDPKFCAGFYAISMFHCLPVGSNSPDALCMGAMWGEKRATTLLKECGFDDVKVIQPDFYPANIVYLSTKH